MAKLLRFLFFGLVVRALVLVLLGVNVRHRQRLPAGGPAIVAANHNSHLDTLVLLSLLPLRLLPRLRPAAAADYFLRSKLTAWFSLNVIGIIPVARKPSKAQGDPLAECGQALERGDILIFFPEGGRGEPEIRDKLKSGIAHLAERYPSVPVIPVYMHGLGKALPKGEGLLVPFFCDVFVGEPQYWTGERASFMQRLASALDTLAAEGDFPDWR